MSEDDEPEESSLPEAVVVAELESLAAPAVDVLLVSGSGPVSSDAAPLSAGAMLLPSAVAVTMPPIASPDSPDSPGALSADDAPAIVPLLAEFCA